MGRITPVILCGGSGTRLWPASRAAYPKQFLALLNGVSSFHATLARIDDPALFSTPLVVAGEAHRFLVLHELGALGMEAEVLIEPEGRESGPAILAAAIRVARQSPDAVLLVLAADHLIEGIELFRQDCARAAEAAAHGFIVTFGITPDGPRTDFGYIRPGAPADGLENVWQVRAFIEKPAADKARALIADGHVWNSGNFCFRASDLIDEYRGADAATTDAVERSVDAARHDLGFLRLGKTDYGHARRLSIDHAVMEHTRRAAVLPARFRWSDIGSWQTLWELGQKDLCGNVVHGSACLEGVENAYVDTDGDIVTAVAGLRDVVVVARRDAVLVTSREHAGDVRTLVERMRHAHCPQADSHPFVHRPWGSFQTLESGDRYRVKLLRIRPGCALSLQWHRHRAEHWVVVRGTAKVTIGEATHVLHENESTFIPIGAPHRLENPGHIDLEVVEVQTGSYTGEDDIVRIEDAYGR